MDGSSCLTLGAGNWRLTSPYTDPESLGQLLALPPLLFPSLLPPTLGLANSKVGGILS